MENSLQAISDLAYVKDIIEGLPSEQKTELFKHFATELNKSTTLKRPTTPVITTAQNSLTIKRLLNSPESPHRSKLQNKTVFRDLYTPLIFLEKGKSARDYCFE